MRGKQVIVMLMLIFAISAVSASGASIIVDKAMQQPIPAQPGQTVEVWVNVRNVGGADARDIEIVFEDSHPFRLLSERDRVRNIEVLGTQKDFVIKYTVQVSADAPEGTSNINLRYSIGNFRGETFKLIPVEVKTSEAIAVINRVTQTPSQTAPGEEFQVTISINNIGGSNLRDFTIGLNLERELGPGDMIIRDSPFMPRTAGTTKSVNRIQPGQTSEFTFELIANPNAMTSLHKVPVMMRYYDDSGEVQERHDMITLTVNTDFELHVAVDSSELNTNQRRGDVTFIVVNSGLADLKLVNMEILENEDFELISPSNRAYLGSLESDDFDTARFRVNAKAQEQVTFPVTLTFRDSLNNQHTKQFEVVHKLAEPPKNGNGQLIILLVVVLVIGIWYYRRRKKKLLEQEE